MGPFLFAKLVPNAETWDDESKVVAACKNAGVAISAGKSYHLNENQKGWIRLTFALPPNTLDEALEKLEKGLNLTSHLNGDSAA